MKSAKLQFLSAMSIFGTIGIFIRFIPLPSAVIALCRGALGLLFLAAVMALTRTKPDRAAIKRNLPILIISGIAMGFNWVLLFESYKYTTVATATVCYYLAPMLLLLFSPLLGEKLTLKKILCIIVALAGLVCISGIVENGLPRLADIKGILFGVAAAILYASVMFLNKKLTPIPAYDKTVLQLGSGTLVLFLYILLAPPALPASLSVMQWILLFFVGIVHTGIAYTLYFGSMKNLQAHTVAIFSYLDPVIAIVLSALLLRETMSMVHIIGTVLILGSALLSELAE